ncbi:hypothetical protein [Streptomyces griseoluteus]|uniref:hypothetical protein n=1 Tax=Streptomyces griseoluteus TaxID=29306 RepID=UPI0036E3CCD4
MLIKGYAVSRLVAGESLLAHLGFWSNYLLSMLAMGGCAERPVPEWFGDDGADVDTLSEIPFDPELWPAFRVVAEDGPGAVVIYRNLDGDYGTDYLLTHPGRSYAEQIDSLDGDFNGTGLTWRELIPLTDRPLQPMASRALPSASCCCFPSSPTRTCRQQHRQGLRLLWPSARPKTPPPSRRSSCWPTSPGDPDTTPPGRHR